MFKNEFNKHFNPRVVQEAKGREFMDLIQGGMIVTEYASKFIQLLWFAAYLFQDKEKMAKKFEKGPEPAHQDNDGLFWHSRFLPIGGSHIHLWGKLKGERSSHCRIEEEDFGP